MILKTKKICLDYFEINPYSLLSIIEFYNSLEINYDIINNEKTNILSIVIDNPGDFIKNLNNILILNFGEGDFKIYEYSFSSDNSMKLKSITDKIHRDTDLVRYEFYSGVTGQFILDLSSDKKICEIYKKDSENTGISNQIFRNRITYELENLISLIRPGFSATDSLGDTYPEFADMAIYLYRLYQYDLLEDELKTRLENIWPRIQTYISHMQY